MNTFRRVSYHDQYLRPLHHLPARRLVALLPAQHTWELAVEQLRLLGAQLRAQGAHAIAVVATNMDTRKVHRQQMTQPTRLDGVLLQALKALWPLTTGTWQLELVLAPATAPVLEQGYARQLTNLQQSLDQLQQKYDQAMVGFATGLPADDPWRLK